MARWWATVSSSELYGFLAKWEHIAKLGRVLAEGEQDLSTGYFPYLRMPHRRMLKQIEKSEWPGMKPEIVEDEGRLVDSGVEEATGILHCSHGIAIDIRRGNAIFGLVEMGEVAVSLDRNTAMDKSKGAYSSAVSRLTTGLIPCILQEIDRFEQFGSIPARHDFLRELIGRYGPEVLVGSSLRWIPTLEQPGNLIHKSRTELKRRLEFDPSVVICSGIAPGKVYDLAAGRLDAKELSSGTAILLPDNEFRVDFQLEQRIEMEEGSSRLRGKFKQIIAKTKCKAEQFRMLGLILDMVAEAWSTTRDSLEEQQWEMNASLLRAYLWVNLKRPRSGSDWRNRDGE